MQHPVSRVHPWHGLIVAMLVVALMATPAFASPGAPRPHVAAAYQDSDADGIADELDPDDDNDGVLDVDEAALGTTPDPGSGDGDGDGDTIPDVLDPDDDNDAVTDDDEAAPPPAPPSNPNQGSGNGQDYDDGGESPPSDEPAAPLVSALPVTGAGSGLGSTGIAWQLLLALSAASIAGWSGVRRHRPAP